MANLDDYNFVKEGENRIVRLFWFCAYAILIAWTTKIGTNLWTEFLVNPTVTSLESAYHPVSSTPFPGIAVCDVNKISKRKALVFARKLSELTNLSVEEAIDNVKILGKMYDFSVTEGDTIEVENFHRILDKFRIDIMSTMRELIVECSDMLVKCRWKGHTRNCSEIFQTKLTYEGYCCTFNYVRGEIPTTGEAGLDKGLTVFVQNTLDDYFYTSINTQGVTIQVFNPSDFPDKPSGGLVEMLARARTENFVEIEPTTVRTVKEVIKYPRQCLFDEERPTKFNSTYSQSDCNVDCRVESMLALCQCIPFMIPLATNTNVCTLENLPCLSHFKNKWNFVYPEDDETNLLGFEKHDALRCEKPCYPSCDATTYLVYKHVAPLHENIKNNYTIIHFFYNRRFANLYRHDVFFFWFEILSYFGGTFGLALGISLISIAECFVCFMQFTIKTSMA